MTTTICNVASTPRPETLGATGAFGPNTSNKPALTLNLPAVGVSASISLEGLNALAGSTLNAVQDVKREVTHAIVGAQTGLTTLGNELVTGMDHVSNVLSSAADAVSDVAGYGISAVGTTLDALV